MLKAERTDTRNFLEKIRFSITRLKPFAIIIPWQSDFSWKDKILDYEIETRITHGFRGQSLAWKDKILDYEIETSGWISVKSPLALTWKDKILDYEIETVQLVNATRCRNRLEKIRFSITRLKHWYSESIRTARKVSLKR